MSHLLNVLDFGQMQLLNKATDEVGWPARELGHAVDNLLQLHLVQLARLENVELVEKPRSSSLEGSSRFPISSET